MKNKYDICNECGSTKRDCVKAIKKGKIACCPDCSHQIKTDLVLEIIKNLLDFSEKIYNEINKSTYLILDQQIAQEKILEKFILKFKELEEQRKKEILT